MDRKVRVAYRNLLKLGGDKMREANYGTIKGAKRYFLGLAEDFCMAEEVKVRLRKAESVGEIERIWKDALRSF